MKISVIIPTYNRSRVVFEAIESVLSQTYRDFELIVVDDGSTDNTKEKIRDYLGDQRVQYVWQENAGVSAARNKGVSLSKGEFVSFLDSDDLWKPEKLERDIEFFKKNPETRVVFTDVEVYKKETFASYIRGATLFSRRLADETYTDYFVVPQEEMFVHLMEEYPVSTSSFTICRRSFEKTGGFDESYVAAEDWIFAVTLSRDEAFGYIDHPLAIIRHTLGDSLNLSEKERSLGVVIDFLVAEKKELEGNRNAFDAACRRIGWASKQLNWYCLVRGRRFDAFKACIRGFKETRNVEFVFRALGAFVSNEMRQKFKCLNKASGVDPKSDETTATL